MAKQMYSLFVRPRGTKRGGWVRISNYAYSKATAIRVYQSQLLGYSFGDITGPNGESMEPALRPVKPVDYEFQS